MRTGSGQDLLRGLGSGEMSELIQPETEEDTTLFANDKSQMSRLIGDAGQMTAIKEEQKYYEESPYDSSNGAPGAQTPNIENFDEELKN